MGEGHISRGSATPLLQGGSVPARPNFGVLFYLCMHPLTQNYQIWRRNTWGRGLFLVGQSHPHPKGRGPSAPQFLRFLSIYMYTLYRRTTKFNVVMHMGSGLVLGGQPRFYPKGVGPSAPPIFGIPFYLCIHLLSQNCQIDLVTRG